MFRSIISRLKRIPIFHRIAIGNAFIIIVSAILGTFLTRLLTNLAATLWHFVLFASIGIVISLAFNMIILRMSLQPLQDLRHTVNRIQSGQADGSYLNFEDTDPDIRQLTIALNSLISQLESSNQQLRLLTERTITAQEDERKRIALSLHDDTGQSLSSLIINLERMEQALPDNRGEIVTRLKSIHQNASACLDNLRRIIADLRPAILDDLGLLPAIRWYARSNLEQTGINVSLDLPENFPVLTQPESTTLFRIAQEAINNIVRHSQAKNASVNIGENKNQVYLQIKDDGHGFDPAVASAEAIQSQHWGLTGIQERIELVGGWMSLKSDPLNGTDLTVYLPLPRTEMISNG